MRWSTWLARIYIFYIYSTNRFAGHGKEKVLKLLLENYPFCHAKETLGDNVKLGADALKQTLKAIIYGICIMQHNASVLTWYAVQTIDITELPHVTIAPFYTSGEYTAKVSSGTDAWKA